MTSYTSVSQNETYKADVDLGAPVKTHPLCWAAGETSQHIDTGTQMGSADAGLIGIRNCTWHHNTLRITFNMASQINESPGEWRNFSSSIPIAACRLRKGDLKLLYRILNEKQNEYRDKVISKLSQLPTESQADFEARKSNVRNAFVTSVTITGTNEESLTGNSEDFFDSSSIPTFIRSVFYSTQSVPSALLNHLPHDRITVFLDFSRRPLLDFERLPTFPTPNESKFNIDSNNESWFSSAKSKLENFFRERKSNFDWLHRSGIYDVMLFFVGFPWAIGNDYRLSHALRGIDKLPNLVSSLLYAYVFLISLKCFE
ncbi:hypothetical protein [Burkholderia ubonensis]|uniref:hypothetical protein n=1 Tax=Burkholderia ubonensis TaxID=101571 RepID=UPI0012F9A158|nr:hypothetical protein [Burkholderia ubonensis]